MPTSPRSPLSFRTAGFPLYGWKDGVSDGAFPMRRSVQACSRHTLTTYWFASVLRASRRIHECPAQCRVGYVPTHRRGGWVNPPPQGSSLESGLCCPGLSSLNRPHPPHSRAHHDFAARRLIRNAFAVRERLGDPRVVLELLLKQIKTVEAARTRCWRWNKRPSRLQQRCYLP